MLISLGLLKKMSRKQFTVLNRKIVLIHCIISLVIFSLSWPLLRRKCTNFREFWPVLSEVPTHHVGEKSACYQIFRGFALII